MNDVQRIFVVQFNGITKDETPQSHTTFEAAISSFR